ncbi:hypothetical protein Lesp02_03180 [Lentzea sp. NBRC 105346]|uniref:single-stranded DNA-binding protein n=1 Tax=Lentzea sp. NBRC 105346 TaxID=3032205 RepID=UPI00249FB6F0|nr:single-stranded DNA-binding protein [Lentzea sp. NBRC 105346]GLZ28128.1 hypothetical protein Lesp02_03180 [Lentzea sp. NBRC 105346]
MAENTNYHVGDLTAPPQRRKTKSVTMATFTLGLNNDRRFDRKTSRYIDGPAAFLNVVCFGELAENILASDWHAGIKIIVIGHLSNDDYIDPATDKTISALQIKAIHAGPSARFNPVTAGKAPEDVTSATIRHRHEPVRAGDTFAGITAALKDRARQAQMPAAA